MIPVEVEFPYLIRDADRHGNVRLYVRRYGRKVRIRQKTGTAAFARAYAQAIEKLEAVKGSKPGNRQAIAPHGSVGWLAGLYFRSTEFQNLEPRSQRTRRRIIEDCLLEPVEPGSRLLLRDCPLPYAGPDAMLMLRDRRRDKPGAANNRLKYIGAMFGWGIENRKCKANPVRDVKSIRYATGGFHTWTVDEVRQYEAHHPVGTKARLALALLLFLGPRRGDVVRLGRQHVKGDTIQFVPNKTRYKRRTISVKPILPVLRKVMDGSKLGDLTFLVTDYGKPFTDAGFGARFRKWCDDAGLPHCTAHGLRKAGATIAAENGATDRQLMALYDWTTASQATVYTDAANKARLAEEAARLIADQSENAKGPTFSVPPAKSM